MPKKVSRKKATKKIPVKLAAQVKQETPELLEEHTEAAVPVVVHEEYDKVVSLETKEEIKTEDKTEDSTMGQEKGIGKEYNSSEFSQPARSADGAQSNKIYWYVGGAVGVIALLVIGLFFMGGFGMSKDLAGQSTMVRAYCSDTDGGYNRFTKGVAEGTYYLNYESGQFMDECAAGEANKLTEYYCKNNLVVYATEPCQAGMTCQDGICA